MAQDCFGAPWIGDAEDFMHAMHKERAERAARVLGQLHESYQQLPDGLKVACVQAICDVMGAGEA